MASPSVLASGVDHCLELVDEYLAPEHVKARRDSRTLSRASHLATCIVLRLISTLRCTIEQVR